MSDALETKVAIVSDASTFSNLSTYVPTELKDVKVKGEMKKVKVEFAHIPTLDKLVLENHDAVILASSRAFKVDPLQDNFITPVIYYSQNKELPFVLLSDMGAKKSEQFVRGCLYDVADVTSISTSLKSAIETRNKLKTYIENNENGLSILSRQRVPRFKKALNVANRYERALDSLTKLSHRLPFHLAMWGNIQTAMLEYTVTSAPDLAKDVAPVVDSFLDAYPDVRLTKSVPVLGEGETGEDPTSQIHGRFIRYSTGLQFLVFREIKARGEIGARQIAEQRYKDARHMSAEGKYQATPLILKPLHLEDYPEVDRTSSFIIMQYVPGKALYKIMLQLNAAHEDEADENKQSKIHLLRRTFIERYVDDCAFWINECTNTFVKKPSPAGMIAYYRARIADIPDAFTNRTTISFSEKEKELWNEATAVLSVMKTDEKHIVRNRDSSLANVVLRLPKDNMSVDEYLSEFGVTSRSNMDNDKLGRNFYHVDMQYRYGHVLEDLAQIATFYEAGFILRNKDGTFTPQNVFKLRDRFFDGIKDKEAIKGLKDDDLTFYLMLWYRAVRKMYLFTEYWENACIERASDIIKESKMAERRLRFTDNITHHCLLAKTLSHKVSLEFNRKYKDTISDRVSAYRILARPDPMNEQQIEQCLADLRNDGPDKLSDSELNAVRLYALHNLLDKIGGGFSPDRKRTSLKNYLPEKFASYREVTS